MLSNFKFRTLWNTGLDDFKYDKKVINQDGAKHTCVLDGKNLNFKSIKKQSAVGQWVFGEQTTDIPLMKRANTFYVLSENDGQTKIEVQIFFEAKNLFSKLLFPIIKKKLNSSIEEGLEKLTGLAHNYTMQELYAKVEG